MAKHSWPVIQKKEKKGAQFLATITVNGSSGPLRFLVFEKERVGNVIQKVLEKHDKERRLPVLGSDASKCSLLCVNSGYDALRTWDPIGLCGCRSFILCKEAKEDDAKINSAGSEKSRKGSGRLKRLLINSLCFIRPSN